MVFYQNNEWHLSEFSVTFTDNDEETTKPVGVEGKDWWESVAENHDDIELLEFIEIEPSDVEVARLEEVNELNIPDGFSTVLADYVENGTFPDEANHPLKDLETNLLKLENKQLKQQVVSQTKVADFQEELIAELAFKVYK